MYIYQTRRPQTATYHIRTVIQSDHKFLIFVFQWRPNLKSVSRHVTHTREKRSGSRQTSDIFPMHTLLAVKKRTEGPKEHSINGDLSG